MQLEITILIAIVLGLTEVGKKMGLPSKYAPLLALIVGVGFNITLKFVGAEMSELVVGGIIAGLTGCGLYSGGKSLITK